MPTLPALIMLAASVVMVLIHAAGAYLGFRGLTVPRGIGVYVSIYESLYYLSLTTLMLSILPIWLTVLVIIMLITHLIGTYMYLRGYLASYASPSSLRYYGVYESFELAIILAIITYMVL